MFIRQLADYHVVGFGLCLPPSFVDLLCICWFSKFVLFYFDWIITI